MQIFIYYKNLVTVYHFTQFLIVYDLVRYTLTPFFHQIGVVFLYFFPAVAFTIKCIFQTFCISLWEKERRNFAEEIFIRIYENKIVEKLQEKNS